MVEPTTEKEMNSDSEDEQQNKDEEEEKSESKIEVTGSLPTAPFVLAITKYGNASALFEIVHYG